MTLSGCLPQPSLGLGNWELGVPLPPTEHPGVVPLPCLSQILALLHLEALTLEMLSGKASAFPALSSLSYLIVSLCPRLPEQLLRFQCLTTVPEPLCKAFPSFSHTRWFMVSAGKQHLTFLLPCSCTYVKNTSAFLKM